MRENLMEKLAQKGEMYMRMRVIGMDIQTGVMQVMHQPLIGGPAENTKSNRIVQKGDKNKDARVIEIQLAGVEYPLNERAIKEMQHPSHKIFSKPQYFKFVYQENRYLAGPEIPMQAWLGLFSH